MSAIQLLKLILRPFKNLLVGVYSALQKGFYSALPAKSIDYLLDRKVYVTKNENPIFSLRNMGFISRKRATTFFTKEPDTVTWIDQFETGDNLLDIGANIGIYSLYAASKGHNAVAIEPQAMNYACLVLNVMDNKLGDKIKTYPFCAHEKQVISNLRLLDGSDWGSANSSFDRALSSHGKEITFQHEHGSYGVPLDELLEKINFTPNHIKIDVDGNELLVLKGAKKVLSANTTKSVLVELADDHLEYQPSIDILTNAGFNVFQKGKAYGTLANYIFIKKDK